MNISLQQQIERLLKYRISWHIGFWLLYIFFDSLGANLNVYRTPFVYYYIVRIIGFIVFTYLLIFIFFPILVNRSRYFYYVIIGLALSIVFAKYQTFNYSYFKLDGYEGFKVSQALPFNVFFFALVTFLKLGKDYYFKQQEIVIEKQRRIELELEFLKSQISPHFLFNTMNNLYGLSVVKSELLPPLMLQLSDLLRYSLYETNQTFVPLEKEINYIKNYIDLEKIRIGDRLELSMNIDDTDINDVKIAPIVLIVFVENAFKHSRNIIDKKIKISFDLEVTNGWITFTTKNNYAAQEKDINSGIGLENIKKRLEYLYPNQYLLNIDTTDNIYTSIIKLKVK
jgi:sensor histidine kinase YesM